MNLGFLAIDNFYDDPDAIRNQALNFNYNIAGTDVGMNTFNSGRWPGITSIESIRDHTTDAKVSKLLNKNLRPALNSGKFRLATKNDFSKSYVHADTTDDKFYAGVLYLSQTQENVAGTIFCTHKKTKTNKASNQGYLEIIKNKDDLDPDQWNVDLIANVVYNRLIVFPGNYYHGVGDSFGVDKYSGRLVQLFFWEEVK